MAKATKRSRKFVAKGGPAKALEKKGASLAKKGKKGKGGGKKGKDGAKGPNGVSDDGGKAAAEEAERKEREENDFTTIKKPKDFLSAEKLGGMDMESFLERAAAGAELGGGDSDDESDADGDDGGDDAGAADESGDDDDDGSVDSYASLGSEEEDIEESEARMKKQLEALASKDPDFHKYLKENESNLLEFGEDEDDSDDDMGEGYEQDEDAMEAMAEALLEDEDDDDDEEGGIPAKKAFEKQRKEAEDKFLLTPRRLEQLEQGAFQSHSIKGLKRIVAAYRTACHLSDANQEAEADSDDEEAERKRKKEFRITSPVVFDRLMAVCLARCHEEFQRHLLLSNGDDDDSSSGSSDDESDGNDKSKAKKDDAPDFDENKQIHPKTIAKSPHASAVRPLLESFMKSTLHVLSEAGKEAKLLKFVLTALSKYVPYLASLPKLSKPYLKTCVDLWSAPLDSSEEHNAVRLAAFLRIRQLAITQPYPFVESALKSTYLAYARRSRFGTASQVEGVLPTLTFMGNCVVELYCLDYASAYQHAFVYIRQLALLLRTALGKGTKEAVGAVACWQYVHCLKLWVAVLSAACKAKHGGEDSTGKPGGGAGKDDEAELMRSLVFPLTEIILGTCRLVPGARHVPLRLHCVRLLQQLAASTETFIPTTSLLLGVLDMKEVGQKPLHGGKGGKGKKGKKGKGTVQGLRLPLILRLPKEQTLRTAEQLDGVLGETFVLLNREADLYRYSPGFPEFSFAILQRLRKFNKETSNGRYRAYSKGTIEMCEKHSAFATKARSTLTDAPKDVRRLEALKPANAPSMGERHNAVVARERRLEAATRPATKTGNATEGKATNTKEKAGSNKRKKGDDEDDDESDAESEEKKAKPSKKARKKKKKAVVNEADLKNVGALEEQDEVQEGIEWSDSE